MHTILTISRQFASGGHTIGLETAKRLGIPCYDEQLIRRISEESGLTEEYIREDSESLRGGITSLLSPSGREDAAMRSYVWNIQKKTILDLAEKEDCVIVGRCANWVLRESAELLRVYIHADDDFRLRRIREEYEDREESPERRLRQKDEERRAYYEYFTDLRWGDAADFDLTVNSGALGFATCAELLCTCFERRKIGK